MLIAMHGAAECLQVWCVIQGWHPRLLVAAEHEASETASKIDQRNIPQFYLLPLVRFGQKESKRW